MIYHAAFLLFVDFAGYPGNAGLQRTKLGHGIDSLVELSNVLLTCDDLNTTSHASHANRSRVPKLSP
jgi:hypothetical protein